MSWKLAGEIFSGAAKKAKGLRNEALITGGISGATYGFGAYATADQADNKIAHYAKWGIAGTIDAASDIALTVAASTLFGFWGTVGAGIGLMGASLMGADPASLAMRTMDYADNLYNKLSNRGPRYSMSDNSAQLLQRQLTNLQGAGSNVAEMMHN